MSSSSQESSITTQSKFKEYADTTYQKLLPIWQDGLKEAENKSGWLYQDYWKAGNSLHAVINYLVAAGREDSDKLVKNNHDLVYQPRSSYPAGGAWRDDYGWWGVAFANAYLNHDKLGLDKDLANNCLNAAQNCWNILSKNADDNESFRHAFPGNDIRTIGADYCPWNNEGAKSFVENYRQINPVPNTVTVCGFWSLTLSLYKIFYSSPDRTKYEEAIKKITDWYSFLYTYHSTTQPNILFNSFGLVRETPNPWPHQIWCFDLDRAWSADQGVFWYCLIETKKIFGSASETYKQAESMLEYLVKGFLNDSGNSSNALIRQLYFKEFVTRDVPETKDSNLSNFNDNYCTGPGVFMRYLGYVGPAEYKLSTMVTYNANQAWSNRVSGDDLIRTWYDKIENTPYKQYFVESSQLWKFAFQVAGLDLFTTAMKVDS
ncbi:MAG: hypothetical protein H6677_16265 [Candidatus Obscuribacterales bacterium]|nr:hypothetical protein [Candidatus Obscuribacterales bacterium]